MTYFTSSFRNRVHAIGIYVEKTTSMLPGAQLIRSLSLIDVIALGINGVIGSGIFLLPGRMAEKICRNDNYMVSRRQAVPKLDSSKPSQVLSRSDHAVAHGRRSGSHNDETAAGSVQPASSSKSSVGAPLCNADEMNIQTASTLT